MTPLELKFLLKLLEKPPYRTAIAKLNPSSATKSTERDKLCRALSDRGLVAYSFDVKKFKITDAGKTLLKQDLATLPLTEGQQKVLEACRQKAISPSEVKKLITAERQSTIQDLAKKGFVKIDQEQIKEVWLTEQGRIFLRDDYHGAGTNPSISLNLLQNYLNFLRRELHPSDTSSVTLPVQPMAKPNDDEILQTIQAIDFEKGTENYLPIFYLREHYQGILSRDDLDQALYRLQRQDKLNLSSLVEAIHYTPEQIQAGIPQEAGGPLFFLEVLDDEG
jgi:predicted transcriptional regulator